LKYLNTKQEIRDFLWDAPYYLFEEAIQKSCISIDRMHEIIDVITDSTALPTTRKIVSDALLNVCADVALDLEVKWKNR